MLPAIANDKSVPMFYNSIIIRTKCPQEKEYNDLISFINALITSIKLSEGTRLSVN